MDILHWWQIKMVAVQLLCLLGVGWGIRYLLASRRALARVRHDRALSRRSPQHNGPITQNR